MSRTFGFLATLAAIGNFQELHECAAIERRPIVGAKFVHVAAELRWHDGTYDGWLFLTARWEA